MKKLVEDKVKAAIRTVLNEDGLKDVLNLSYNDLEYNLEEVFVPKMRDQDDDAEYDRLHDECENMAKSIFSDTRRQLRVAYATIEAALSIQK